MTQKHIKISIVGDASNLIEWIPPNPTASIQEAESWEANYESLIGAIETEFGVNRQYIVYMEDFHRQYRPAHTIIEDDDFIEDWLRLAEDSWRDEGFVNLFVGLVDPQVRFIAKGEFVNQGTIRCTERDAKIYIVADSFVNNGKLECGENGEIIIFCNREYTNNGVIKPEPRVIESAQYHPVMVGHDALSLSKYPVSVIEYFLFCLERFEHINEYESYVDKEEFYKNIGVRMESEWFQSLVDHKALYESSLSDTDGHSMYRNTTFIERLINEFDIEFFRFYEAIWNLLTLNDEQDVVLQVQSRRRNSWNYLDSFAGSELGHRLPMISSFMFKVRSGPDKQAETKEFTFDLFETASDFRIPNDCKSDEPAITPKYVFAKNKSDDASEFILIKTLLKRKYVFEQNVPLHITQSIEIPPRDRSRNESGALIVQCDSDIVISPNIMIKGSEIMMHAKGAEIRLIGKVITNSGTLCCNGSEGREGGIIHVVADSFVNDGQIECVPYGQIHIFCREYINNGTINPSPFVRLCSWNVIDYFLFELERADDSSGNPFFEDVGVSFKSEWIPLILSHDLMTQQDDMLDQLFYLQIPFFSLMVFIRENSIIYKETLTVRDVPNESVINASDFVFAITLGELLDDREELHFDNFKQFSIDLDFTSLSNVNSLNLNIFCKRTDESFGFVPIHSMVLNRYLLSNEVPLAINESVDIPHLDEDMNRTGTLLVRCLSDIVIGPKVNINGVGTGENGQGGNLRLISTNGTITNDGTIRCNGDGRNYGYWDWDRGQGGTIYIVGDSFVNNGDIDCNPDGQIFIFAKKFINNGTINPEPIVNISSWSVIEYFLFELYMLSRSNDDIERDQWLPEIGLSFRSEWIPIILRHNLLFQQDSYQLIRILSSKLLNPVFSILYIIRQSLVVENNTMVLHSTRDTCSHGEVTQFKTTDDIDEHHDATGLEQELTEKIQILKEELRQKEVELQEWQKQILKLQSPHQKEAEVLRGKIVKLSLQDPKERKLKALESQLTVYDQLIEEVIRIEVELYKLEQDSEVWCEIQTLWRERKERMEWRERMRVSMVCWTNVFVHI